MTSLLALVAHIKLNANREEAKGAGRKTCTILRFTLKLVCVKKKKNEHQKSKRARANARQR